MEEIYKTISKIRDINNLLEVEIIRYENNKDYMKENNLI